MAADPAAGPSDDLETAQAPAMTARRPSAWTVRGQDGRLLEVDLRPALAAAARWLSAWRRGQWYFLICLVLFLVLFVIGVAVLNYAAPYGLHRVMGGFIVFPAATTSLTEAVALYGEVGDRPGQAYALDHLGVVQLGATQGATPAVGQSRAS